MAKVVRKSWSRAEDKALMALIGQVSWGEIASVLGRSESACQQRMRNIRKARGWKT